MDPLTHFIVSLAAGYILVKGMGLRGGGYIILYLSALAALIDVDHVLPLAGLTKILVLHNISAIVLATLAVRWMWGFEAAILLATMLVGHILLDINIGLYGIPLLYPLTTRTFLVPITWEAWLFEPSYTIISKTGICLAVYATFVSAIIVVFRGGKMQAGV